MLMRVKWSLVWLCILGLMLAPVSATAATTFESNYTYDFWGSLRTNRSLPAFELVRTIDNSLLEQVKFQSIDDVHVGGGRIFLVDATDSRVTILDENLQFVASIKLLRDAAGRIIVNPETNQQLMLNKPEGVYYSEVLNELYIADTGAERIIVLDGQTYTYLRTIERPDNMVGVTQFKPSKLVVNKEGKISVVVQGSYEGIIELNRDGTFSRYFGVNKPRVNLIDYFWKSIASSEQKEKMGKTFAPSFNNISIDPEGLIYATTYDSSAQDWVFRFNAKGENVLMENGYFPIIGDIHRYRSSEESKFIDIAVTDYGVYAVLDRTRGQIFVYNFQGDLLNIFGSTGNLKGSLKDPSAIAWLGDNLIVTDRYFGVAHLYQPTEFGHAALAAEKAYYQGRWAEAGAHYEEALHLNTNYDIAYIGVGRNYLMQDRYEEAMYYLKLGNARGYYSMAYAEFRNLFIQRHFIWFVLGLAGIAGALIYSEYRYNRRQDLPARSGAN